MISTNNPATSFYNRSLDQLTALRNSAERLQGQIATGEKLERGSDDPVASSRLRALARADRLAEIDESKANSASLSMETASATLEDMSDIIIRARELAVQAASDSLGADGREAIATEIDELRTSLLDLANLTDNSGQPLFGGDSPSPAYVTDVAGTATYNGSATASSVEIGLGIDVERGVTGPSVFNFEAGGAATDAFALLANFASDLRRVTAADPAAAARDALAGFDNALDTMSRSQTVLGARLAWIDNVQFSAALRDETRAEEQAELGDVDLTEAITQLQQTLTVLEASQASFARLTSLSLFDQI